MAGLDLGTVEGLKNEEKRGRYPLFINLRKRRGVLSTLCVSRVAKGPHQSNFAKRLRRTASPKEKRDIEQCPTRPKI
jgi:hypothetical protein